MTNFIYYNNPLNNYAENGKKTKIYQEKVSASDNSVFKDNFSDLVNKICCVCRKMHTLLKKIGQTLTNKPTSFF